MTGRLRQFHAKVALLGDTLSESLTELRTVQAKMSALATDKEKAAFLREYLAVNIPAIKSWSQTLSGLRIKSLLETFAKYEGARQTALERTPDFGAVVTNAMQSLRDIESGVAGFMTAARNDAGKAAAAAVAAVEKLLENGLTSLEMFENRIKALSQNFDARMDSLVAEAQQGYATRVGKHCFWWGLGICVLANADAVSIYSSLSDDPKLRTSVIENMESYTNQPVVPSYTVSIDRLTTNAISIEELLSAGKFPEAKSQLDSFSKEYTAIVEIMEQAARDVSKEDDDAADLPFLYKKPLESLERIDEGIAQENELDINMELVAPSDFVPALPGWRERCQFIAKRGSVDFYHFDFYTQALSKIERSHTRDLGDVRRMVEDELVEPARLRELFLEVEPELARYPAIDPKGLRKRVDEWAREG